MYSRVTYQWTNVSLVLARSFFLLRDNLRRNLQDSLLSPELDNAQTRHHHDEDDGDHHDSRNGHSSEQESDVRPTISISRRQGGGFGHCKDTCNRYAYDL